MVIEVAHQFHRHHFCSDSDFHEEATYKEDLAVAAT
jgi:hypothetical protein